jgi:uroporphyrinogen decarboxylase
MRQAGRYLPEYRAIRAQAKGFLDLCYDPAMAAEVTLQPVRRYGLDAAILFSDILVVPHAMGLAVTFEEERGPVVQRVRSTQDVERLEPAAAAGRLEPVLGTVTRVRAALAPDVTLIGFAGAPWTVATYMVEGGTSRDFAATRRWAFGDPEGFGRLIAAIETATIEYLVAQVTAGADVVQLFDSWAGVLADDAFERWCVAPTARIVAAVKARTDVPVIGFPRGAGVLIERYAAATGVDAVGLDTTVPLAWARDVLQPKVAVQGNLDPLLLVTGGAAMEQRARAILDALGHGPFVFNLGHGVVPETPPDHVARLVACVREWRP